jgi:phosphoglycerate kinase
VLLENVRFHAGDENGDAAFASELASNGDVFVERRVRQRRTATTRRCAASRASCRRARDVCSRRRSRRSSACSRSPRSPYVAILGGAKVATSSKVIDNLLERVVALLVGGGMAYTLLAAQGQKSASRSCSRTRSSR